MLYSALITKLETILKNNTNIAAWCTTNYTRAHYFYIETDPEDPPDPATVYPIVALSPIGWFATVNDPGYGDFNVLIAQGIRETGSSTGNYYKKYTGVANLMAMQALVQAAIMTAGTDLGGSWVESIEGRYEIMYPDFLAFDMYTFKNPDRYAPIAART